MQHTKHNYNVKLFVLMILIHGFMRSQPAYYIYMCVGQGRSSLSSSFVVLVEGGGTIRSPSGM